MNNKYKILVLVALIIYTIAPDPIPGPIDDLILWAVYVLNSRKQQYITDKEE